MEKAYNFSSKISTFTLCCIILSSLAILARRAVLFLFSVLSTCVRWMATKHNFTPGDDEDPVTLTGAQYLCFALLSLAIVFVLSIKF